MKLVLKIIYRIIESIASIAVTVGILFFGINYFSSEKKEKIKNKNTILEFNFEGVITERNDKSFLDSILKNSNSSNQKIFFWEILNKIKAAAEDKFISGIILNIKDFKIGYAQIEELRKVLEDFKKSGKFIITYSESILTKEYYLASISDYIFLHPSGFIFLTGIASTSIYYKNFFDKINSEALVFKSGKYKSAPEIYTKSKMSEENKEQLTYLLNKIFSNFLVAVEKFSNQKKIVLNKLFDDLSISNPIDAFRFGIISHIGDIYDVEEFIKKRLDIPQNEELEIFDAKKYDYKKKTSKNIIAVIPVEGVIVSGKSNSTSVGAASIVEAIKKIKKDKKIKAVIIRINSPGGSAIASDIIFKEIKELKKIKPVVVSMSNYAASGGYFISIGGDKIFCYPNTITGSIGVFFVKFEMDKLFNNFFGITTDSVKTNEYSDFSLSPLKKLSDLEKKVIQKNVDLCYNDFISKVAKARGMSKSEVDKVAQGKIWLGEEALQNRLVSTIGTFDDVLLYLEKNLKISDSDYKVEIISYNDVSPIEEYFGEASLVFKFLNNLFIIKNRSEKMALLKNEDF